MPVSTQLIRPLHAQRLEIRCNVIVANFETPDMGGLGGGGAVIVSC
jgi:hypothetical protein